MAHDLSVAQHSQELLVLVVMRFLLFPVVMTSHELIDTHMDRSQAADFVIRVLVENGRVVVECFEELEVHDAEYAAT